MKVTSALTLDIGAQSKSRMINELFAELNNYIQSRNYGNGILEYLMILQIVNPPKGYEHLHKDFKPKFIEYKSLSNKLTGEPLIIEKQFSYSLRIDGEKFDELVRQTDEESKSFLASEIINSLSNLDALPQKVKDFDREKFKADMKRFFT